MEEKLSAENKRLIRIVLLLIMLAPGVLGWLVIDNGHDYRGDFAMYVSQAQALLNGTTQELYEMNKFAMNNSDIRLGPYLYQMGFSVLLAGVLAVFGLNFYAMKGLCLGGLVLSIPLLFKLFRPHFKSTVEPLLIVTIIAVHSSYIIFCDSILSDFPFLFFILLAFILFSRKPTLLNQITLGFFIYFAYIIRDIGIVLLPTLMVFQLHRFWLSSNLVSDKRIWVMPYLVFAFLMLIGLFALPFGQENHFKELFSNLSGTQLWETFKYYRWLINDFFYFSQNFQGFFYSIVLLTVLGCISMFKRVPHLVVYIGLSISILMIWPHKQGIRFLFPVLPFVLFFIMKGLQLVFEGLVVGRKIVLSLIGGFLVFSLVQGYPRIREYAERDTNQCYTKEMQAMYKYMATEIPKGKLVGSYYPRVTRLFTGLNALRTGWNNPIIDYNQTSKEHVDYTLEFFEVEFMAGNEVLTKRIRVC